jgi:Putative glucoamylase
MPRRRLGVLAVLLGAALVLPLAPRPSPRARPLQLPDQRRRLPVEHPGRPRHRRDLPGRGRRRIAATLASVARLERHQPSGMFYNWYDPSTGAKLTTWPVDGGPVHPFLALPFDRRAALDNLASLRRDFDAYGEGGFYDAVNVDTGQVSRYWLALDQRMVIAAIANRLDGNRLQRYLTAGAVERAVRPLLAVEEFTAGA